MKHTSVTVLVFTLALLALPGCKTPRCWGDSIEIRFEPAPSPPIHVEHQASYALWWIIGWAPGGSETLGHYESDEQGTIDVRGLHRDLDQLLVNDKRFIPFCISGPGNRPMTAWLYDEQTEDVQVIAEESDGVLAIPLKALKHE